MNKAYLNYQKKLEKFNRWEEDYLKNIPLEKRIWQFFQLYQLKNYMPEEIVRRIQEEHLECLIKSQKIFGILKENMMLRNR
jgi:hypothetical protein